MGSPAKWDISEKRYRWMLWAVLLFGLATKLFNLDVPKTYYFDETYHAFTAHRYLMGDKEAYNPWAKSPEPGNAYEWIHPPLSKHLMALNMIVFGDRSFGWRIGSVVASTIATALLAALAWELFGSRLIALLAAYLFSVEGLIFAQSRLAMNDIYLVMFSLMAFLFYVRWKKRGERTQDLFLAGLALGCAASTKWTAFYLFVILGVDVFRDLFRGRLRGGGWGFAKILAVLVAMPLALYLMSYWQYFYWGYKWKDFVILQDQIITYHLHLKATHTYKSKPWEWVLNLRPVWFYVDRSRPGFVGNIYNLGNSVVLLGGLYVSVKALFFERRKSWEVFFTLLCYFMFWLPWSFSPRVMLFYHYTPAVPFLILMLARSLAERLHSPERSLRVGAWTVLVAAFLWFGLFYPNATAIPVSDAFANTVYFALPGWR